MTNRSGRRRRGSPFALGTRQIVFSGMLGGITAFLAVAGLGVVPVPSLVGNATILHVPAIVGGALEGPLVGSLVGAVFGLYSWMDAGPVVILRDPLVSVLPRLAIGVAAWAVFAALRGRNLDLASAVAGVVGSLANTAGVLGMAVLLGYLPPAAVVPVLPQAAAEAVLGAFVSVAVVRGVTLYRNARSTAPEEKGPRERRRYSRALDDVRGGRAPGLRASRQRKPGIRESFS